MTTPLDTLRAARARHVQIYQRHATAAKYAFAYDEAMKAMEAWLLFHGVQLHQIKPSFALVHGGWGIVDLATGDTKTAAQKYFALTAITRLRPDLFEDQP